MKRKIFALVLGLFWAAAAGASTAHFGGRAGFTFDPDQFHLGPHVKLAEPFPNVTFLPNVEFGFGNEVTTIAFNAEFVYNFSEMATVDWEFYAGGGPALNYFDFDGGSSTDVGLNALGGVIRKLASGNELFFELKLGLEDSPDLKLTAGLTFF